ncbi:unnamed protein product [Linum trigynum]|uniref:Uncharacterized protein n=1 Tax=Linum trigynum TaxID=586398 RepID=A0AAV2FBM9_9ROSI
MVPQARQKSEREPAGQGTLRHLQRRDSSRPQKALPHQEKSKPSRGFPITRSPKLNMGYNKTRQNGPDKKVIARKNSNFTTAGNPLPSRQPTRVVHGETHISRVEATTQKVANLAASSMIEQGRRRRLILESESKDEDEEPFPSMREMANTSPLGKPEVVIGESSQHVQTAVPVPPPSKNSRGDRTVNQAGARETGAAQKGRRRLTKKGLSSRQAATQTPINLAAGDWVESQSKQFRMQWLKWSYLHHALSPIWALRIRVQTGRSPSLS